MHAAPTHPRKRTAKPATVYVVPERGELSRQGRYVQIPIKIVSEANAHVPGNPELARRARMAQWARKKKLKAAVDAALLGIKPPPVPCVVRFVRIAPAKLDRDNNVRAFKHAQDRVAAWLGIDDRDTRVYFAHGQAKGAPRTYGMRIEWWPVDEETITGMRRASGELIG